MTKDDIIRMALEAGWPYMVIDNLPGTVDETRLQRFAALVAAAEREECYDAIHKLARKAGLLVSGDRWLWSERRLVQFAELVIDQYITDKPIKEKRYERESED